MQHLNVLRNIVLHTSSGGTSVVIAKCLAAAMSRLMRRSGRGLDPFAGCLSAAVHLPDGASASLIIIRSADAGSYPRAARHRAETPIVKRPAATSDAAGNDLYQMYTKNEHVSYTFFNRARI